MSTIPLFGSLSSNPTPELDNAKKFVLQCANKIYTHQLKGGKNTTLTMMVPNNISQANLDSAIASVLTTLNNQTPPPNNSLQIIRTTSRNCMALNVSYVP